MLELYPKVVTLGYEEFEDLKRSSAELEHVKKQLGDLQAVVGALLQKETIRALAKAVEQPVLKSWEDAAPVHELEDLKSVEAGERKEGKVAGAEQPPTPLKKPTLTLSEFH